MKGKEIAFALSDTGTHKQKDNGQSLCLNETTCAGGGSNFFLCRKMGIKDIYKKEK